MSGLWDREIFAPLISSAPVSPVKIYPLLDVKPGSTGPNPDCSLMSLEFFARYDRASSSWKTSRRSDPGDGSDVFCGSWPRAGMMRNGIAFLRPPSAPLTEETESLLLPTPAASSYGTNQGGVAGRVGPVRASLETLARLGQLPTPTANRSTYHRRHGNTYPTLVGLALSGWAVTPTAHLAKECGAPAEFTLNSPTLTATVAGAGGYLHPQYVEWMMSFPRGWTDLDGDDPKPINTGSELWATPLCLVCLELLDKS